MDATFDGTLACKSTRKTTKKPQTKILAPSRNSNFELRGKCGKLLFHLKFYYYIAHLCFIIFNTHQPYSID